MSVPSRPGSSLRALLLLGGVVLTGCSMNTVGQSQRAVQSNALDAERFLNTARQPLPPAPVRRVVFDDSVWTGSSAIRSTHGLPLPFGLEAGNGVGVRTPHPLSLQGIAAAISRATSIPVILAPDVNSIGGGSATPSNVAAALTSLGVSGSSMGGEITAANDGPDSMTLDYSGPLSALLNQVTAHFGLTWSYNGSQIQFSRYVTRSYIINALASNIDLNATLRADSISSAGQGGGTGGGGATAGSSGGSTQSATSKMSVSVWRDLINGVRSIVGPNGAVAATESTGMLTVTAPPSLIDQVQGYIDQQNDSLSNQVAVSVEVLSVQLNNSDNYQVNLSALYGGNGVGFSGGNNGGSPPTGLAGAAASAAATALTAGVPGLGFGILSGRFAGTNGVINALSQIGRVSVVTTSTVTTLSGVPAPLQVTNTRGYLANVTVTSLASNGLTVGTTPQTSLTAGSVTTGFNLDVLPRVNTRDHSVMMQFGINISALNGAQNGFDTFTSGGQTIQLPNVNQRNFIQEAQVPDGATLVLTGYGQTSDSAAKSGTGTPDLPLLGGGQNGTHQRDVIVILITPVVLHLKTPAISTSGT